MEIQDNPRCFVCKSTLKKDQYRMNTSVMKPVCLQCAGSEKEKQSEENLLDSLADGLVCGCI